MKEHLKRVAKVFTGTTPPTNISRYYDSEDVLWFSPGDILSDGIIALEPRKISKSFFHESRIKYYPAQSVLMVGIGATVGKIGYSDKPFYTNQQINTIVFDKKKVLPKYGAYYLLNMSNEINRKTPVVTLQIFNQSKVKQIIIDYPIIEKQQRIVDYLDAELGKIDARIAVLEKEQDAYARLKKSVIHHAVTRGLDPNASLKDSGVEWIGMIPEHWETKRIKDVVSDIFTGVSPVYEYDNDNQNYVFGQRNNQEYGIDFEGIKYAKDDFFKTRLPKEFLKYGDVLLNTLGGGSVGRTGYYDIEDNISVITDGHVMIVRSKTYNTRYMYYYLCSRKERLEMMAIGSTNQAFFNISDIRIVSLPMPSLGEQQTIASYLDDKCARIDATTENIGKQIDALKRLKRALINEVVTGQRAI